jgi:hypothetical protein
MENKKNQFLSLIQNSQTNQHRSLYVQFWYNDKKQFLPPKYSNIQNQTAVTKTRSAKMLCAFIRTEFASSPPLRHNHLRSHLSSGFTAVFDSSKVWNLIFALVGLPNHTNPSLAEVYSPSSKSCHLYLIPLGVSIETSFMFLGHSPPKRTR